MGTRVVPPETGANCGHWDPPDETPIALYCLFWDVEKGDRVGAKEPPNGHIFKLDQRDTLPCDWRYTNLTFGWEVNFGIHADRKGVDLRDAIWRNNVYFLNWTDYPPFDEYEVFTNDKQWPAGEWGCKGHCVFFWLPTAILLAEAFGLDHVDDLMLETFPVSVDEFVIKLCSLTLRTNVKFKISP